MSDTQTYEGLRKKVLATLNKKDAELLGQWEQRMSVIDVANPSGQYYASADEHGAEISSKAQEFNPAIGKVISEDTMEVTL